MAQLLNDNVIDLWKFTFFLWHAADINLPSAIYGESLSRTRFGRPGVRKFSLNASLPYPRLKHKTGQDRSRPVSFCTIKDIYYLATENLAILCLFSDITDMMYIPFATSAVLKL